MTASSSKERLVLWLALPAMVLVLVLLGVLQYRWSGEVRAATRSQMQSNLQASLMGFRMDLVRELGAVCLEIRTATRVSHGIDGSALASQLRHWRETASHPALVSSLYVVTDTGDLFRLDEASGRLQTATWPSNLGLLREKLVNISQRWKDLDVPPRMRLPRQGPFANLQAPWMVEQASDALVHPVRQSAGGKRGLAWLIVQLNANVLQQEVLPELSQKYFNNEGREYQYAVRFRDAGAVRVLYSSSPGFGGSSDTPVDAALNLFGPPGRMGMPAIFPPHGPESHDGFGSVARGHEPFERMVHLEPIHYGADDGAWELVVKHQSGSVEAAVASLHTRHLVLSFSVLLLLATTMGLVLLAAQRAHRLARLQMEFVAGVSHELRTPLSVISSAAENLAHGVVQEKEQISRYSNSILRQTRNLTQLVEQVLVFASVQRTRRESHLHRLDVAQQIETALENMAPSIAAAGITVERSIEPGLPLVQADAPALLRSLQNLISNAVKYGGEKRWLKVSARANGGRGSVSHVEITVEDRGLGMGSEELKHIFDPFYRSPAVANSNVHGAGLGLPLAKAAVEALGGRLTVQSERGKGSSFTISLPAAAGEREGAVEEPFPGEVADDYS